MTMLLVAVGGAMGAAARYLLDRTIATRQTSPFPLGTLVINVTGSVALGGLLGWAARDQLPSSVVAWAGTGFLGAYTTFSTSPLRRCGCWRMAPGAMPPGTWRCRGHSASPAPWPPSSPSGSQAG
jgi:protein CrcB